jgi:N-glycosylase/DNA lyase
VAVYFETSNCLSVANSADSLPASGKCNFAVADYDLAATLNCGQAFNWHQRNHAWEGVIYGRWVRLCQQNGMFCAETAVPQIDWAWLMTYLQSQIDLGDILATFPAEPRLKMAVEKCRGLRLLRQDPWECLVSFILSSTKQIVQIRQIIALLRVRFGSPLPVPAGAPPEFSFPTAEQLATASEAELRACKMGFRAPYLLAAARQVANGECNLERLATLALDEARSELLKLLGVGEKIADCVLLFAYGFPTAFPIDVWVAKALRQFYFRGRKTPLKRLRQFATEHFGPNAGYAQQYLFHYIRTDKGRI